MNDYLGVGEVADLIGLKRSTVWAMHSRGDLPDPDLTVNQGHTKLWLPATIEAWDRDRQKNHPNRKDNQ